MAWVTFSPAILLGQNASAQSDTLKTVNRLKEVVVRGYGAERNLKAPEMGRVSLSSNMIANLPVMFGEPDIVKALQTPWRIARNGGLHWAICQRWRQRPESLSVSRATALPRKPPRRHILVVQR